MSVESNFILRCENKKQVEIAEKYPVNLKGRGQKYPISEVIEVDGNEIKIYNCLCIIDFEKYLIDWCIYIAENAPAIGFEADGEFTHDTDGYTIIHKIKYDKENLYIETRSGYEDDDEDLEDPDQVSSMETIIAKYRFKDGHLEKVIAVADSATQSGESLSEKDDDEAWGHDFFEDIYGPLEEYEEELEKGGILPDAPPLLKQRAEFLRVHHKAEEGDERAITLLKILNDFLED